MDRTGINPHGRRARARLLAAPALVLASLVLALPRPTDPEVRRVPELGRVIAAQGNAALHALKQEAREAARIPVGPSDRHLGDIALAAAP